jgi:hypothetical protein
MTCEWMVKFRGYNHTVLDNDRPSILMNSLWGTDILAAESTRVLLLWSDTNSPAI